MERPWSLKLCTCKTVGEMAMTRPSRDETMLRLADVIAERSTCSRRKVGCVLTDEHGRVLAMGHNGVPRGMSHCTEFRCSGAASASGTDLHLCQSVHAEQNALLFCADIMKIETVYVTASPCVVCVKMLMNTAASRIVFREEYPHHEARSLWMNHVGQPSWEHLPR